MNKDKELELYFHIPFCVKKCNYCDFLSAPSTREVQEAYMGALFAELEGRAEEYKAWVVSSIFIGGGTPSMIEGRWIQELLKRVRQCYRVCDSAEITIEVNPGTADAEKLKLYKEAGINRLSLGLQSGKDEELWILGRIHSFEQFVQTYQEAREVGFNNVNVDIMSALPGQNLTSYKETLQKVLSLTPVPEHISAYSLMIEEGTLFAKWEEEGVLSLPDEECERQMYEETKRILGRAGSERYEISNYALKGYECRHNIGYWRRKNYVGFGIGSASMVENCRFKNSDSLQSYIAASLECRCEVQKLGVSEQMEEFMFLGLRMIIGVSEKDFLEYFGKSMEGVYGDIIQKQVEAGLLYSYEEVNTKEKYVALTSRGLDVSNYVMAQFLLDEEA